jgi:tetratricopeptide (TPR) repeat protein
MAIIKNRVARGWGQACVLVAALLLQGCQPPGPRALLKGEALIRKGRYAEAIEQLQKATQLLPQMAQSWNYLGLAYHGNSQPQEALRAYQKALSLDHTLAAAHFNLGCLYLEQNNLSAAVNELTAFTMIESHSVEGWLKLGTAQLRAGRLDGAEKAFRSVLEIQAQHPEALNGLGVVKYQRRRNQEALDCFNAALAQRPTYAAALLNAAVVSHQTLNNRAGALEKYRQYLALDPRPSNWATVEAAARQLESELNPPASASPARPLLTEVPSGRSPRSASPMTPTNATVRSPTDRPGSVSGIAPGRPGVGTQPPPRPAIVATSSLPRAPVAPHITVSSPAPILTRTTSVAVVTLPVTNRPADLEVTYLTEEPMIKPPSDGAAAVRGDPLPATTATPDRTTSPAPGTRRT